MSTLPAPAATDIVLVAGVRTPFSKFGGALREVPSVTLGGHVIRQLLEQVAPAKLLVDEIYYGVTLPAEVALDGPTSGRQALLRAGLPDSTVSLTIDRGCCSSLTAVLLAARSIRAGDARWVVAAGAENMGRATFLAPPGLRFGHRGGPIVFKDPLYRLGADISNRPVAVDAGEVALEWGVTREMQDEWAAASHQKYFAAKHRGFYNHVAAVEFPEHKATLDHDELARTSTTPATLSLLKTAYDSPTITAGNAPGLDTGAVALLITTRAAALSIGAHPMATIVGLSSIACAPREIIVAPGPAILKATTPLGWKTEALDALEINEAFAAVPLVTARYLAQGSPSHEKVLLSKTNVNGGAVAIGHPTGASGARLLLQLAHELRNRGGGRGVATICGALGQADAVALVVHAEDC